LFQWSPKSEAHQALAVWLDLRPLVAIAVLS
jgi:hypothetical protein